MDMKSTILRYGINNDELYIGKRVGDFVWFETLPFGCGHYIGGINLNEITLLINNNT
jgi:hypothetical protein